MMERKNRDPEFWVMLALFLLLLHSMIRLWGQKVRLDRLEDRVQELELITPRATEYK